MVKKSLKILMATAVIASAVVVFGGGAPANAAPLLRVASEEHSLSIPKEGLSSIELRGPIDISIFNKPALQKFAQDNGLDGCIDWSKIRPSVNAPDNYAGLTILPGALKAEWFERIEGNKDGQYRKELIEFNGEVIRIEFLAKRRADGSFDYADQEVRFIKGKAEFKDRKAFTDDRNKTNEIVEDAKAKQTRETLENAKKSIIGKEKNHYYDYWKAVIDEAEVIVKTKEDLEESLRAEIEADKIREEELALALEREAKAYEDAKKNAESIKTEETAVEVDKNVRLEAKQAKILQAPNTGTAKVENSNLLAQIVALVSSFSVIGYTLIKK